MGHLKGFWPGEIGNLNNSFHKSQMLALMGGGGEGGEGGRGVLKLRFD